MSYTNVCSIIESCGKFGVKKFKMNNIEIDFHGKDDVEDVEKECQQIDTNTNMSNNDTVRDQESDEAVLLDSTEDIIESLALTDPLSYEQGIQLLAESDNAKD